MKHNVQQIMRARNGTQWVELKTRSGRVITVDARLAQPAVAARVLADARAVAPATSPVHEKEQAHR